MKYVLDSSAALPWVLPEKDSPKAIQLRDDARNGVHQLVAPDIFPAEVFTALLKAERPPSRGPRCGYGVWAGGVSGAGAGTKTLPPLRLLSQLTFPADSALAQPQRAFGGQDLYPSLAEKAAALGFSRVGNHPFVDGSSPCSFSRNCWS